jgi:hypothetical protein
MDPLYTINSGLNSEYLKIIDEIFKLFFSMIFMIMLEPIKKFNSITFLAYQLIGSLFYNLIFKNIIKLN